MTDQASLRRHDQKSTEILLAVWRVIAERGISGVTIRAVAARAGVSVGRVQHYFATKDELIRASADLMISAAESIHTEATAATGPAAELWDLLTHPIPHASASPTGTAVFYSFVADSVRDPQIAAILVSAKSGAAERAAALLVQLDPDLPGPDAAGRELIAVSDGATLGTLIGSLNPDQARAVIGSAINRIIGEDVIGAGLQHLA